MSALLNRRLAEWERMQSPGGRQELGAFTWEGTRLAERALRAELELINVFVSESFGPSSNAREAALLAALRARQNLELHCLPDANLRRMTGGRSFGDVLGVARLPREPELSSIKTPAASGAPSGVLVVIDATDPGNVGALVRTALASGARGFLSVGSTDPYHPKAVRTSMGSLFRLPVRHYNSSADLFRELRAEQFLVCGAVAREGQPLPNFANPESRPVALLVGSEAFGLSTADQAELNLRLTVPMPVGVDSLSINAAAAVCLYELLARGASPAPNE